MIHTRLARFRFNASVLVYACAGLPFPHLLFTRLPRVDVSTGFVGINVYKDEKNLLK